MARAVPADQGLERRDGGVVQVQHRLVVQRQPVGLDRPPQVVLRRQAGGGGVVHRRVEDRVLVLARQLGAVHRGVGVAHHVRVGPARPARGDADAQAHGDLLPGHGDPLTQAVTQGVGQRGGGPGVAQAVEQHHELVAAQPRGRRIGPAGQGVAQPAGHGDQQLVARVVAQAVVDQLEVVQVDEQHRVRTLRGDHAVQPRPEPAAVGQAGQRVVPGVVLQPRLQRRPLGLQRPPLGDVAHHSQHAVAAVRVAERRRGDLGGDQPAAAVPAVQGVGPAPAGVQHPLGKGGEPFELRGVDPRRPYGVEFGAVVTQQLERPGVGVHEAVGGRIDDEDRVVRALEHAAEARLADAA